MKRMSLEQRDLRDLGRTHHIPWDEVVFRRFKPTNKKPVKQEGHGRLWTEQKMLFNEEAT